MNLIVFRAMFIQPPSGGCVLKQVAVAVAVAVRLVASRLRAAVC